QIQRLFQSPAVVSEIAVSRQLSEKRAIVVINDERHAIGVVASIGLCSDSRCEFLDHLRRWTFWCNYGNNNANRPAANVRPGERQGWRDSNFAICRLIRM